MAQRQFDTNIPLPRRRHSEREARLYQHCHDALLVKNYVPYGGMYGASGVVSFEYAGKMKDVVTSLYYSNARWNNPGIGRFITEDSKMGRKEDLYYRTGTSTRGIIQNR